MSDTIKLLSSDSIIKQYWEQYETLAKSANSTLAVLRALGVKGVPDDMPLGPIVKRVIPAPSQLQATDPFDFRPLVNQGSSLSSLVREAAQMIKIGITRDGIVTYIQRVAPEREIKPHSLSALISQIAKDEGWKLVEAGIGGRPSIYDLPL